MQIPKQLNVFALSCLKALQNSGLGKYISLGGAIGLAHYYEYRTTKDVDAWWTADATEQVKKTVIALLKKNLENFGEVSIRRFGDVVSIDLTKEKKVYFNFQIACRSALLRPLVKSPLPDINLDSLEDLIASKMTALIERGAPRDFLDIYQVCVHGFSTPAQCWLLWQEREQSRGVANINIELAIEAILLHLNRIEKSRPLQSISDVNTRNQAQKVREWFKNEFYK
jgi:predicted nucleotidyltransferase component of viral defense system